MYTASWYCNALFHHRVGGTHTDQQIVDWFDVKLQKVWEHHSLANHTLLLNGCDHTGHDYGTTLPPPSSSSSS